MGVDVSPIEIFVLHNLSMKRALAEFCIEGVKTTIPFHRGVMEDEDFNKGNIDTHFLERFEKVRS